MTRSLPIFAFFTCLWIGQAFLNSDYRGDNNKIISILRKRSRPSCRSALSQCLSRLDAGTRNECQILPIPPRAFLPQIQPGTFQLTILRNNVWMYNDGVYLTLILLERKRLALIDFPDSLGSNTNEGNGTLLTDAIETVLEETTPKYIDMVYSHAHLDHIGGAKRVFSYLERKFPRAGINIWGSQETKEMVESHKSNRAVAVTNVVEEAGVTLKLSSDLELRLSSIGGHTQQDLLIFIPGSKEQKSIAYFADVVYPKLSLPFDLALTQNMRSYQNALKVLLRLDFDIFIPGHFRPGTKKDIRRQLRYVDDLLETVKSVSRISPEQLAEAGLGRTQDPNAREFRNMFLVFVLADRIGTDACYRIMIEKWGCKLASLDLFLRGHCSTALFFSMTDL